MKAHDTAAGTPAAAVEADLTTLDALAHYVARHLEDGASPDQDVRRRYGRLVGFLADHAESLLTRLRRP